MNSIVTDFLIGIIGGLVATFLTLVIRNIWLSIIVPWYENRIYVDARIEGRWKSTMTFEAKDKDVFVLELERHGHAITGTHICIEGFDQGRIYPLSGTFRNLILTLTYISKDQTALDRGTMTLMLVNNGNTFTGNCAYYSTLNHKVETCPVEFQRQ